MADKARKVQHKLHDELDRLQPGSQEVAASGQGGGKGGSASAPVQGQQQPLFQGPGRRIITETEPEAIQGAGRIPSNTPAAQHGVGAGPGQGSRVEGQGWQETKARVGKEVSKAEEKAVGVLEQVKDSVKSAAGMKPGLGRACLCVCSVFALHCVFSVSCRELTGLYRMEAGLWC